MYDYLPIATRGLLYEGNPIDAQTRVSHIFCKISQVTSSSLTVHMFPIYQSTTLACCCIHITQPYLSLSYGSSIIGDVIASSRTYKNAIENNNHNISTACRQMKTDDTMTQFLKVVITVGQLCSDFTAGGNFRRDNDQPQYQSSKHIKFNHTYQSPP